MSVHQIWIEGYAVSCDRGTARKLADVEAATFAEACDKLCAPAEWQREHGKYDPQRGTVWGCRLFNNEADARHAFG